MIEEFPNAQPVKKELNGRKQDIVKWISQQVQLRPDGDVLSAIPYGMLLSNLINKIKKMEMDLSKNAENLIYTAAEAAKMTAQSGVLKIMTKLNAVNDVIKKRIQEGYYYADIPGELEREIRMTLQELGYNIRIISSTNASNIDRPRHQRIYTNTYTKIEWGEDEKSNNREWNELP